jgi:hypothetical protein
MDSTPRLHLPYIAPQQAQKQVTYNDAMRLLDLLVQPAVLSRSLVAPPGTPTEGDSYIVAPGATAAWIGRDGQLATLIDGGWEFRAAAPGWLSYVADSAEVAVFTPGGWTSFATNGGSSIASFGINAGADLGNRLVVAAEASLFTHDGAGHQLKLNKAAAGDTASVLFQTGWSGRAEFGLAGDDELHVKVSADGSAWHEALVFAAAGPVRLPQGQLAFPASPNPSNDPRTLDDYAEGSWTPAIAFGGSAGAAAYGAATAGRYTKIGRLCVASGTLALTSKGSATGAASITGLPFAALSGDVGASCCVGRATGFTGITGAVVGLLPAGGSAIALSHSNNGAATALTNTQLTNTSDIRFSVSYETA